MGRLIGITTNYSFSVILAPTDRRLLVVPISLIKNLEAIDIRQPNVETSVIIDDVAECNPSTRCRR
jgi:hypothetical protein